ncbi:cytochrome p450 monooxygenase [Grosmannia clavigera kw1407]|uniref:Cytochrome p450 monooxygenase n=1 Tax=Grosmannia clavigera (strain kw1407 / UAMH 11150) TaxID=655863 RepID=F0X9V5_GROCL|nr:cytochrome p450 monooxygenase [Grosmannia clavigera kw1407]EFX05854.1 cytochrome p450 monooxygenase [Grosmannia clavigera kw1407]
MQTQTFYFLGEPGASAKAIDLEPDLSFDQLQALVGAHFAVVKPSGIAFQSGDDALNEVAEILAAAEPVALTVDGHAVRDVPSPPGGLPYVGNYLQIYPDHLGNHQRLFESLGPVIKTVSLGRTVYQTNDPELALVAFAEDAFFTKHINEAHPLFPIKTPEAGVFLGDTDTAEWRLVHKFLPPALGPKAVRHYAPTMQQTIESAFAVFDALDTQDTAWNVYPYMVKLGSQAVGKITLGIDFGHFAGPDAPMHEMVSLIAELLSLNKKVMSRGDWYRSLPFGDPARLRAVRARIEAIFDESVRSATAAGVEDLPLQTAALQAANMVDYAVRAVDSKGEKLPSANLLSALIVVTGAGFTTTSSLLSWLIYSLVTYPGVQDRLLQELVDHGFDDETVLTADFTDGLPFLDNFVKETLRRHNPSYQPGRTAKADLVLPGGYRLPRDTILIPALHHIHNNPAVWDNPTRYDPDRWDTPAAKAVPKGAFMPFAAGPRMCIGFHFALQEVKVFLPKLVYRYEFIREGDGTIEYDPMFQLIRPNNLYVRASRRVKWPLKTTA